MDADEESRSRQYDGTTMSDDEVSKVPEMQSFGIFAKSYIKEKIYNQNFHFTQIVDFVFTV